MKHKLYLGIDPGKKGGVAWIWKGKMNCVEMPSTIKDLWNLIGWEILGLTDNIYAVLEHVHSMPQDSGKSMFTFGNGFGHLQMALVACSISTEEIPPKKWQKALYIVGKKRSESKPQFKDRLRGKAQQLYPGLEIWSKPRSKGKQLAICDAVLIATYCQRKHEGTL